MNSTPLPVSEALEQLKRIAKRIPGYKELLLRIADRLTTYVEAREEDKMLDTIFTEVQEVKFTICDVRHPIPRECNQKFFDWVHGKLITSPSGENCDYFSPNENVNDDIAIHYIISRRAK
jgi:hypothetical protein